MYLTSDRQKHMFCLVILHPVLYLGANDIG